MLQGQFSRGAWLPLLDPEVLQFGRLQVKGSLCACIGKNIIEAWFKQQGETCVLTSCLPRAEPLNFRASFCNAFCSVLGRMSFTIPYLDMLWRLPTTTYHRRDGAKPCPF